MSTRGMNIEACLVIVEQTRTIHIAVHIHSSIASAVYVVCTLSNPNMLMPIICLYGYGVFGSSVTASLE